MRALGIDIGGSSVKAALIHNGIVQTIKSERYIDPDRDSIMRAIVACLDALPDARHRDNRVGLCLPGKVSATGACIERSVNLPCLMGWSFDEMLKDAMGFAPASHRVVSDIHATAHDLFVRDGEPGRAAIIAIGTGVGLMVLEDGKPLGIGRRGIGHLGQIDLGRLGSHDVIAPDGSINTLECYVGLRALRARLGDLHEMQLADAISRFGIEDPFMQAIVRAVRIVHAIYTPESVCFAGGLGLLLESHRASLKNAIDAGLTTLAHPDWSLRFGDSLYHAAVGAARLAAE